MHVLFVDQIEQAVADMNSGLQLRELLLEPYDRRLAEGLVSIHRVLVLTIIFYCLCSHFNLGLAYSLQKDHQSAIKVIV